MKLIAIAILLTSCSTPKTDGDYVRLWVRRDAVKYNVDTNAITVPMRDIYYNAP